MAARPDEVEQFCPGNEGELAYRKSLCPGPRVPPVLLRARRNLGAGQNPRGERDES